MDTETIAKEMILAGVKRADPENLVARTLTKRDSILTIREERIDLNNHDQILVLGIGKASQAMAKGLEAVGIKPDNGLLITKKGSENLRTFVPTKFADHPYPKSDNLQAGKSLLETVGEAKNALIIFLISGGGSSLFCVPEQGITIEDMTKTNQLLVKSGANIQEINTVRKHLSKVKGGKFARFCEDKGDLVSLILSDVVGDDLSVIASGPTYPDTSTFREAINILKAYEIWGESPANVREYLRKGDRGAVDETPEEVNARNFLIANNLTALKGAEEIAENYDLNSLILSSRNKGEAKEVAPPIMGIAKESVHTGNPVEPPAVLLMGGEMTVTHKSFDKENKGGPNREFVLQSALEIRDTDGITVASADTDGVDGKGKSGAIANTNTVKNPKKAKKHLSSHRTEDYFDQKNQSLQFKSRTNVNDITAIITI